MVGLLYSNLRCYLGPLEKGFFAARFACGQKEMNTVEQRSKALADMPLHLLAHDRILAVVCCDLDPHLPLKNQMQVNISYFDGLGFSWRMEKISITGQLFIPAIQQIPQGFG